MATGRRPFEGRSSADLLAAILRDAVPPVTALAARSAGPPRPRHPALPGEGQGTAVPGGARSRRRAAPHAPRWRTTDVSRILRPPPVPSTPLARPRGDARSRRRAPAQRRASAHHHRLRRHRQDALRDRAVRPPRERLRGRRGLRLARLGDRGGGRAADGRDRARDSRGARAARRSMRSGRWSEAATCCSCSTTSSRCWTRRRTSPRSSRVARGCGSSPPAARRSRSAPRPSSACRRSSCPRPAPTALDALRRCPSVALFVQRAAKVKPGFALERSRTPRRSPRSAAGSTACRSRSSWPPPARASSSPRPCSSGSTTRSTCSPPAIATCRCASGRSARRSAGATRSSTRRSSGCCAGSPCFHEGWTLEAMEQVCYAADERHAGARRARLAGREGAGARRGRVGALRAARDDPRLRRRAAPRERRGGDDAPRARGLLRRVRGASRRRPPHARAARGHAARPPRRRQLARGDRLAHRARARRRRRGARAGAPAVRPPGLVLAHRRPAPDRARGLRHPAGARRRSAAEPRPRALVARGRNGLDHDRRVGALARRVDPRLRGRRGPGRGADRGRGPDGHGLLQPEPRADRGRRRGARRRDRARRTGRRLHPGAGDEREGHAALRDGGARGRHGAGARTRDASRSASATTKAAAWRRASSPR